MNSDPISHQPDPGTPEIPEPEPAPAPLEPGRQPEHVPQPYPEPHPEPGEDPLAPVRGADGCTRIEPEATRETCLA